MALTMRGLILLLCLAGPTAASLAVGQPLYRWTDEAGEMHVTDDPNQVPERYRPKPPPPDPRVATGSAIDALKALAALVSGQPLHEDYAQGVAEARKAVRQALGALERGAVKSALTEAMRCFGEAADLWDNQLKVRKGIELPLNMMPIKRAWECGAQKTAEAERGFAAGRL